MEAAAQAAVVDPSRVGGKAIVPSSARRASGARHAAPKHRVVATALERARTTALELNITDVLAIIQAFRSGQERFHIRPQNIDDDPSRAGGLIFVESRTQHAARRLHPKAAKVDRWRNGGGKNGLIVYDIPSDLVSDECDLLCRRRGFVERPRQGQTDHTQLRYHQFTVAKKGPSPADSDVFLYHVLPADTPAERARRPRRQCTKMCAIAKEGDCEGGRLRRGEDEQEQGQHAGEPQRLLVGRDNLEAAKA